MESLQTALGEGLGKGFAIAARLGHRVLRTAIFNALFIFNEEDLVLAIEQDVDLLACFLIYAPKHVQLVKGFAGRVGKGFEKKVTMENALRWVKEECDRKKTRHYDIIVNLPEGADPPQEGVFLPRGYDKKRVKWFWSQVQKLLKFIFYGEISKSTKKYGVEHLKWLAKQQQKGKAEMKDLLQKVHKDAQEQKKEAEVKPN